MIALDVFSIQEGPYECESDTLQGFAADLCAMSNTVGPWNYTVVIADARNEAQISWQVSYFVWHPPETQSPDDSGSDSNEGTSNETSTDDDGKLKLSDNPEQIAIILGSIVALLLIIVFFTGRKKRKRGPSSPPPRWN